MEEHNNELQEFERSEESESPIFAPPAVPIMAHYIECGHEYMSSRIWFDTSNGGPDGGFWRCPIEGCGGAGFGFDIYPADGSDIPGVEGGWIDDDGNRCPPPWLCEE